MKLRKKQTAVKGRFSAMFISGAVHVAVLVAAGTFVAVTVVQRQEARFEGRQVSRPKMQLQRLQVPQRARTERQAPQMSQRVTAQAISTRSIDFQMPEIAGLGGGISVDMSGAGFAGSLGFATPQINVFGLRSQGEKVVFLLDTNRRMLVDEIGGIPAYEIIKGELMTMISRLPPTTLFNVIVFEFPNKPPQAFSAEMNVASSENIERLRRWLSPLNAQRARIGFDTLGFRGVEVEFEPLVPIPNTQGGWIAGLSWAIRNGADSVYWLGVVYAVGYQGGKLVTTTTVETTGSPHALRLSPHQKRLRLSEGDACVIDVAVVDAQERVVPVAENLISFEIEGSGKIIGVGNGDPSSHEADKASCRRAFNGLCQVIVKGAGKPGEMYVRASSPYLESAVIKLINSR